MENIIETQRGNMIFNGGNPLENCPKSYVEFWSWIDKVNEGKEEFEEPLWDSDCGFKADFDGPIIRVNSRFWPPKTHYGEKWTGVVGIYLLSTKTEEREFETTTFGEMVEAVEEYVKNYENNLYTVLKNNGLIK